MKRLVFAVIVILAFATYAIQTIGQTSISAEGVIESKSGGFKFPDGSVQLSAVTPPCTAITYLPFVISSDGVYCFTGDLVTSTATGAAITIAADNVTIEMNGWTLDGLGAGAATQTVGIHAYQRRNATIRNGTIQGFYQAVFLEDIDPFTTSEAHLVEDIRATRNTLLGINVQGEGSMVRRNRVAHTGGASGGIANGIVILGPGVRAIDNDINGTSGLGPNDLLGPSETAGLAILFADGAVVEGNRVADATDDDGETFGIWISESDDVLAVGNRLTGLDNGIEFDAGVSGGKYMFNLTSGVTTPFTGGTPVGTNE